SVPGAGPGAGWMINNSSMGGAHGGNGGDCNHDTTYRPVAYEADVSAPILAGSTGGGFNADAGGSGGGVVRIVASGAVVIDGIVDADGEGKREWINTRGYCGGGGGGSVWISALSVSGTGSVSANGGERYGEGGSGGGGCIALHYDDVAQGALGAVAVPSLSVTTYSNSQSQPYNGANWDFLVRLNISDRQAGTLWFSDGQLVDAAAVNIKGFARIYGVKALSVAGDWTLSSGHLLFEERDMAVSVSGDLTVDGAETSLRLGMSNAVLAVGGNLTVSGGAKAWLKQWGDLEGALSDWEEYGSLIEVGGDIVVSDAASVLQLYANPETGAPWKMTAQNLSVGVGARLSADGGGYAMTPASPAGVGPGTGSWFDSSGGGAGYGGLGGHGNHGQSYRGETYGEEVEFRPILSGSSGGGTGMDRVGGAGGGVLWIEAPSVTVDGTLSANGKERQYYNGGGGSGGSIFIVCDIFAGTGAVTANGGSETHLSEGGGGGGGRIAVTEWTQDAFSGTFEAAKSPAQRWLPYAEDGTAHRIPDQSKIRLTVYAWPETWLIGDPGPYAYGITMINPDTVLLTNVLYALEEPTARRICTGYAWENGEASGAGTDIFASVSVTSDTDFTWYWTNQWLVTTAVGGSGTVSLNGAAAATADSLWVTNAATITVEAFPGVGHSFYGWTGDGVTLAMMKQNPLTLPVERAWGLTAAFVNSTPMVRTWDEAIESGAWEDGACWIPAGVPGPGDSVTIANATVAFANPWEVSSFILGDGGTLVFDDAETVLTAGTVVIKDGAVVTHAAFGEEERETRVAIVATSMTIEAGGMIDVVGKGYAGSPQYSGRGGYGPGAGAWGIQTTSGGGAGHGGAGGNGRHSGTFGGPAYGDPAEPILAGSGGSGCDNNDGGAGGGIVRLIVDKTLTMDGVVTASGDVAGGYGGTGAGGSIWISTEVIVGGGSLHADGGMAGGEGGAGGGGRIRLDVDSHAQAIVPTPFAGWMTVNNAVNNGAIASVAGTVWLDDETLFNDGSPTLLVQGNSRVYGVDRWMPNTVAMVIANGNLNFMERNMDIAFPGTLTVEGAGTVISVNVSETPMTVAKDIVVQDGGRLNVNAFGGFVSVDEDEQDGTLTANPVVIPAQSLSIAGTLFVRDGATLGVAGDPETGGPLKIEAANVAIEGTIDGNCGGFAPSDVLAARGNGPGGGSTVQYAGDRTISSGGGGYGGAGGEGNHGASSAPGLSYGYSDQRPVFPGSSGATTKTTEIALTVNADGEGGALVWIVARRLTLSGTIRANGAAAVGGYDAAGSGGGIWIECSRFIPEEGATMEANGGNSTSESGSGGGGRIQVWYANRANANPVNYVVDPGTCGSPSRTGEPGTWFEGRLAPEGTLLIIR
ncbi:MAG: hypothetical protein FWF84_01900, partial [Kiritimatiellaeota bacterium]|nr:hypothetical protein [Kiritimatiellota bacterium]